ncbi:hypothetical protein VTH06DRAFT_7779 [Thermothelomyces fergusii]
MAPRSWPKSPAFRRLMELEEMLMELPADKTTFSIEDLKSMGIEREPRLNIDDPDATDSKHVFFKPFPDTPAWRHAINDLINEDVWDHCPDEKEHFDRLSCALHDIDELTRITYYAMLMYDLYPDDAPRWEMVG